MRCNSSGNTRRLVLHRGYHKYHNGVVLVSPDAYGYGFGGLNDSIWGYWPADNFADQQYTNVNNALQQYSVKLDIIYDDPSFPNYTSMYSKLIYWNDTIAP